MDPAAKVVSCSFRLERVKHFKLSRRDCEILIFKPLFNFRDAEQKTGGQYGTMVIIDLDGLSLDSLDWTALKCVNGMLSKLQELFPDVLRKLYIIRAPSFVQLVWAAVSPCLAKQTQQKIEFLGADWKEKLKVSFFKFVK